MSAGVLTGLLLLAACGSQVREVGGPFYVMRLPDSQGRALFRCPEGPKNGCAIDGLPGPDVVRAGADNRYVVVERQVAGRSEYFYFARVPEERRGWGQNPERIIGPLDAAAFDEARSRLDLPGLSVEAD